MPESKPKILLAGHRSAKQSLQRICDRLRQTGADAQHFFDGDLVCLLECYSLGAHFVLLGLSPEVSYDEDAPGFAQERQLAYSTIGGQRVGVIFHRSRRYLPPYLCGDLPPLDFVTLPPGKDCAPLPEFYRTVADTAFVFEEIDAEVGGAPREKLPHPARRASAQAGKDRVVEAHVIAVARRHPITVAGGKSPVEALDELAVRGRHRRGILPSGLTPRATDEGQTRALAVCGPNGGPTTARPGRRSADDPGAR